MRCPDAMNGIPHESHWHTVFADNITVAGGLCHGIAGPVGVITNASILQEIIRTEQAIGMLIDSDNRDQCEISLRKACMDIIKRKLSQGAEQS